MSLTSRLSENNIYTFAYGANMDEKQMKERCPGSKVLGPGRLVKYQLNFTEDAGGWEGGVADIVSDRNSEVWGLVFKISPEGLKALDKFETYPKVYTRFQTTIDMKGTSLDGVWVYSIVNKKGFVPPAPFYMEWLKQAAEEYSFPNSYQLFLNSVPLMGSSD